MYTFDYIIKKEDINYGGHVGNERSLLFFQWARMAMFESFGLSESDIGEGVGVIQKDAFIEYDKQMFEGDNIKINITKIEYDRITFTLYYEILRDQEKTVSGHTKLVAFDYANKKIKRIPAGFIGKAEILLK